MSDKKECLKCGKEFNSTGKWNRICNKCNRENASAKPITKTIRGQGKTPNE